MALLVEGFGKTVAVAGGYFYFFQYLTALRLCQSRYRDDGHGQGKWFELERLHDSHLRFSHYFWLPVYFGNPVGNTTYC
ncbi:hypothetical protein [Microbulbifer taiwanensis]|uniref:hypothetical protein n=1 Tax=Microbulbifer taiwanensis TaxID=986746 RepID=UPI00361F70CA